MYYNFTSNIMGKGSFSIEMEMGQLKNKNRKQKERVNSTCCETRIDHDKVLLFSRDLDILINKFMNIKDKSA